MQLFPAPNQEFHFDFRESGTVKWGRPSGTVERESTHHAMRYFIDDETIDRRFGHELDSLSADWIDMALACYLADRLALRPISRNGGRNWSRVFNIVLPVREIARWTDAVHSSLARLLRFLTEDIWQFEFTEYRGPARATGFQRSLFPFEADPSTRVVLYSGGLDSFAGAAQELYTSPGSNSVLVSGVTNPRQRGAQRSQVARLRSIARHPICQVAIPYGLRWPDSAGERRDEASQRTRGFLFLTLGAVSAIAAGASTLFLYENGVGAINLPYDATQVGTYKSRATHPSTLFQMEDFIKTLTGREFSIDNPFLFTTKGEMCKHEAVGRLRDVLPLTFSCDGFPVRVKNRGQCGFCTSCLLRRQSIEAAGLAAYDTAGYLNDLCSPAYTGSERHLHALRAMDWQAHRIRHARSKANPWEALLDEFVELHKLQLDLSRSRHIQPSESQFKLLRLYTTYADEWRSFSAPRLRLGARKTA